MLAVDFFTADRFYAAFLIGLGREVLFASPVGTTTSILRTMKIGETLYVKNAREWRDWLTKHHETAREIWLVYYKKGARKASIPDNDAVNEALCYGWIDSIVKKLDDAKRVQRFTPRRDRSPISEMNKERLRRLAKARRVTAPVLAAVASQLNAGFSIPADILVALQADRTTWRNFRRFPTSYQRIRVAFVVGARNRPDMFQRRLRYLVKMTAENKRFGMVR